MKLGKNVLALLFTNAILSIVSLFSGSFLIAYFYNSSNNFILTVSIYHICLYSLLGIFYWLLGYFIVNAKFRDIVFRIGIVLKCIHVFLMVILKDDINNYIVLMGFIMGLGEAFYWTSFHVIKNDIVKRKNFGAYSYLGNIVGKSINIVVPIVLGFVIDSSSFLNIAIYIFILCVISLVLSFMFKSQKLKETSYNISAYLKKLFKNKEKYVDLKYVYWGAFSAGMRTIIGTLCTMIIMLTFGTNLSLGLISGIITICTMLLIFLIAKYKQIRTSKTVLVLVITLPIITTIMLMLNMSKLTIVLFNLFYSICCTSIDYSFDINRYALVKKLKLNADMVEHHGVAEIIVQATRIFSYGIMALVGLANNLMLLNLLLFAMVLFVPLMTVNMYKLDKKIFAEEREIELSKKEDEDEVPSIVIETPIVAVDILPIAALDTQPIEILPAPIAVAAADNTEVVDLTTE